MRRILIAGGSGRMGRALIEATLTTDGATLVGATVREGSSLAGVDAAELVGLPHTGAPVVTNVLAAKETDVLSTSQPSSRPCQILLGVSRRELLV